MIYNLTCVAVFGGALFTAIYAMATAQESE